MKIAQIHLYPVKGLKGISVSQATVGERGLEGDRRYMLIDRKGYFLSQRSHPQMALYRTALLDSGHVHVSYMGEELTLSETDVTTEIVTAGMFEHEFPVHVLSTRVNEWWSKQLGEQVCMVYQAPTDTRIKNYIGDGDSTEVNLADGYPILLLGTASMQQLNDQLEHPIGLDRFRPNIVLETQEPHIEDTLRHIQVGTAALYVVKPCARCQVITIDQETAQVGKEPLRTLAKYRKVGNKVNFGANAVSTAMGIIAVGDELQNSTKTQI